MSQNDLDAYKKQLTTWIKASGKSQQEIAELTKYFAKLRTTSTVMVASTLGRTIDRFPVKHGVNNLCAILGVFYMLKVVQKSDIIDFKKKYAIHVPEQEWDDIWKIIETGAVQGQAELEGYTSTLNQTEHTLLPVAEDFRPQKEVSEVVAVTDMSTSQSIPSKSLRLIILSILVGIIGIVIIGLAYLVLNKQVSTTVSVCATTVARAEPIFLPDQGFSQYTLANGKVLGESVLDNNIRSIGVDEQGLWVGYRPTVTSTEYVSIFDKTNWTHSCTGTMLSPHQNVNSFAFLGNSTFMATDGAGVGEFDGSTWQFYTQADGLPSNSVYELIVIDGELWASTYEGVARFVDRHWQTVYSATPSELASNHVYAFRIDKNGNRWFGFIDRGISRLDAAGRWYSYFTNDVNLQNIRAIALDESEGVWFATDRSGILRFQHDIWTTFNVANGQLPSDVVHDVEQDAFGRIWVATERGLAYTADFGETWNVHSTMNTLDIEFGCDSCPYFDQNHILLVLKEMGLGHTRIPPLTPTVRFVNVPPLVQLKPGETYIFQVEVQVLAEQLTPNDGDSLRSNAPRDTYLYGAYPIIPVTGEVNQGETYTFSNADNPVTAPDAPGIYQTTWRVWQGRRFVSEPITIEFEVVGN